MGQTLTHGIYLPDEGERNCYAGLAANWQLLDSSVGTIAEHTTALAGKAPLVHTHTKSDITDFPAYGNAAGTICEGNDSRLSDARTPVAHTHSKADITDLFNSANTWTGNNYFPLTLYQKGFSPRASAPAANEFGQYSIVDTSNSAIMSINYANRTTGARDLSLRVFDGTGNVNGVGVFKDTINNYSFCCIDPNNTISLGNSAIQWKSIYAQSYYYNGVAWGLDQANVWTGANTWENSTGLTLKQPNIEAGVAPSARTEYGRIISRDSNGRAMYAIRGYLNTDLSNTWAVTVVAPNNSYKTVIEYNLSDSDRVLAFNSFSIVPASNNTTELGTSSLKWKTLNGVNPGALSLPKTDTSVTAISTSGFSFDGSDERIPDTTNLFSNGQALVNGWLCARIREGAGHYIFINSDSNTNKSGVIASCFSSGVISTLIFGVSVYVPVKVGDKPAIRWAKPNGGSAQLVFYPCLGNV